MKRIILAIVLVLALNFGLAATPAMADGTTRNVPENYGGIQEAIDAAGDGDIILVAAGTYDENIQIDKALEVRSVDGAESSVINGTGSYIVTICHSDVVFEGFTVTNPDYDGGADASGILIQSTGEPVDNVRILNNIVTQVRNGTSGTPSMYGATGINVGNAPLSNIVISGNTIIDIDNPDGASVDHTCGINIWDGAESVVISGNTISDIKYNGIILECVNNIQITGNTISQCKTGIRAEPYEGVAVSNVLIEGNAIDDNHDGIVVAPVGGTCGPLAVIGNIISGFAKGGVVAKDVSSVQIEGNIINTADHSEAPNGIQVGYIGATTGTVGTINGNQVSGCRWDGYDPMAETYEDDWTGSGILVIDTASQLEISGNEVQNCDVGMDIESGTTAITGNDVHGNSYGFVLWNARPTINCNDIYQNGLCGVYRAIDGSLEGDLDAICNWFGDISGAEQADTNPGGLGDVVGDGVNYMPWLTREFQMVLADGIGYFGMPMVWLNTGWNTFSTPVALDSACDTWGEYVELGDGLNIHPSSPAYSFSGTTQTWVPLTADYRLTPCDAIYVRMNEPDIAAILISPEFSVPTKELHAGWNLSSLSYLPWEEGDEGNMPVDEALVSVYMTSGDLTGYTQVVSPPLSQGPWSFVRGGDSPPEMHLTKGYWVFMGNGPDTLAGFAFTPISFP